MNDRKHSAIAFYFRRGAAAAALFVLFSIPAKAERTGDQGLGLMLGNPSGISWKMWFTEDVALDAALGVDQGDFDIHSTLLFHNFKLAHQMGGLEGILAEGELPLYIGVGPRFLFANETELGIRVPLGIAYMPHNGVWDAFFELAPVLRLTPSSGGDFDFAIGGRYYFAAVRPRSGQ